MNNCATCGSPEMLFENVPFRYGMDICAIRCTTCYNFVCAPRSWKEDPFHDEKALWNAQADKVAAPTQVETQPFGLSDEKAALEAAKSQGEGK